MVRQAASAIAQSAGFSEADARDVALAVNEACTNVIKHAYCHNYDAQILLSSRVVDGRLELRLRDYGKKTDPGCIKGRDLDDIRPGGLGVHFINEIMDEVQYNTGCDVGTELRMVKRIK